MLVTAALIKALPLLLSAAVQANQTTRLAAAQPRAVPVDSSRVSRDAKAAQVTFERTRRANLPINTRGTSGRCDVRVGRFCYWWDDGEFEVPAELPRTKAARTTLLTRLTTAAATLPGDRWIAGQRVRYLVEADRAADAVTAATECQAEASWCSALAGFAYHAANDFTRADSAFSSALASMSERERCRWTDISLLIDGDARKRYDRQSCTERATFESRFWALSRPLFLLPANDLKTEHFARLTMIELIRESRYGHTLAWDDDAREMLLRYGWETGWSRDPPTSSMAEVHVVGHEPTPAFDFVPATDAIEQPDSADASDWELHDRLAQTRYAPRYARSIRTLTPQVALFRRGDSALVVAAYDVRSDSVFTRDSLSTALAVAPVAAPESATVRRDSVVARHHVLTAAGPVGAMIVSVEARDSSARRVARARTVVRPPASTGRVTISDLLLFDNPADLPATLEDAIKRARGSLTAERNVPLGVYWEMYGVDPAGETLEYTLTVARADVAWYRRAAEKLKVVDRRSPVKLQWNEPSARPGATRSRALAVDLSTLAEGRYRVELTLDVAGQAAVTASRVVEVVAGK